MNNHAKFLLPNARLSPASLKSTFSVYVHGFSTQYTQFNLRFKAITEKRSHLQQMNVKTTF